MKKFSIQRRIFISIVLLVSFLFGTTILINHTVYFQYLKDNETQSAINGAQKTIQNIEIVLKLVNDVAGQLSNKPEIQAMLAAGESGESSQDKGMDEMLKYLTDVQSYYNKIFIIGYNGQFFSSDPQTDVNALTGQYLLPDDYRTGRNQAFNEMIKQGHYTTNLQAGLISYFSPIYNKRTGENMGLIIIDLDYAYLRNAFTSASYQNLEKVIVVDPEGSMIFTFPYHIYLNDLVRQFPEILKQQTFQTNSRVFGIDSIIVSSTIEYSGWKLVRIINTDNIYRSINTLNRYTLYIFILFILVSFMASYLLSVSFTRPIVELNKRIKQVESGDLSSEVTINRQDELGELSRSFSKMVVQLKSLIEERIERERKKSQMEFKILQEQINPHFLYNILNSIKWLAVIQNVDNISDMTSSIINLLKYNISSKKELVTLDEEINSIKDYVSIQEYRYGSNFSVEYNIAAGTKDLKILKFILQPLVENSIFHGFKNYKYGGEIKIRSGLVDRSLTIQVNDNGSGFDSEQNEDDEKQKMHSGIGLDNVNERIKLYFGPAYGINIVSKKNEGTSITIVLPIIN